MIATDIISVDQAKMFLRVDFSDDDTLIAGLINSAFNLVEQKTQYRFYQRVEIVNSDGTYNVDLFQKPLNSVTVLTLEGNPVTWCQIKREPVRTTVIFRRSTFGPFSGYGAGFTGFGNGGFGDGLDNGVIFGGQGFPASLPLYNIAIDCGYTNTIPTPAGYTDISACPPTLLQAIQTIISYTYENRDMSAVDLPSNILMELESYVQNPMF
jgi:hypothetical protein